MSRDRDALVKLAFGLIALGCLATTGTASARDIPGFPKASAIRVDGVEQTQAIQYYKSMLVADPNNPEAGPQPDNSIPMVSYRHTGLRFYVDAPEYKVKGMIKKAYITGKLTVRSPGHPELVLAPKNVAVAQPAAKIDRGEVSHTLNFVIPAEYCHDTVEVELQARLVTQPNFQGTRLPTTTDRRAIRFKYLPPVELAEVRVRRVDASGAVLAPEVPQGTYLNPFMEEGARVMPITFTRVVPTGRMNVPLQDPPKSVRFDVTGPEVVAENFLATKGDAVRVAVGEAVYVAILPWSVGMAPDIGNPTVRGAALYASMVSPRFASHELGHAICGLRDISFRNGDPSYPLYQTTYPNAVRDSTGRLPRNSIGEFGYDPLANKVYKPDAGDFMVQPNGIVTSGSGVWVSPYHYMTMMACFERREWSKPCDPGPHCF